MSDQCTYRMRSRRLRADYPQILISHKADMEARDVLNRTPLMSAAIAGQVDVVRFFFDQGERIWQVTIAMDDFFPLFSAVSQK